MAWLALCRDREDKDSGALRQRERAAHFAYIESILDRLLIAGPLGAPGSGGHRASVFIYMVDDQAEAERLLHADPYYRAGIYGSVEFLPFTPAAGQWIGGTIWGADPR